jgi:glycerophosphoryl diester phosphodiesterase
MKYGFAHRGGAHGPDNAIVTFADALARGATGLETDAWLSLDGNVVLDHDGVAGPPGRQLIAEVRRDQLPTHMATLDELYERCGTDFALAIDVKTAPVAAATVAAAERHGATANLWIVAPATVRGNVLRSPRRATVLELAREAGVEAINARWMWWNRSFVREVHALGMLAFGYDAQRAISLDRCVAIGLDGVFSDHVDRMLAALDRAAQAT